MKILYVNKHVTLAHNSAMIFYNWVTANCPHSIHSEALENSCIVMKQYTHISIKLYKTYKHGGY